MSVRSDQDLVRASRKGDYRALDELFSRYTDGLYRFVLRMCHEATAAEDIVQDSCVKAWQKLASFQDDRNFKPWLFAIARNTTLDYLKKKRAVAFSDLDAPSDADEGFEERIEDLRPLPLELLERQDEKALLEQALQTIPLTSRTTLLLHEGEDLTFQEIAKILEEPLDTVKSRYRRALIKLRSSLKDLLD